MPRSSACTACSVSMSLLSTRTLLSLIFLSFKIDAVAFSDLSSLMNATIFLAFSLSRVFFNSSCIV